MTKIVFMFKNVCFVSLILLKCRALKSKKNYIFMYACYIYIKERKNVILINSQYLYGKNKD